MDISELIWTIPIALFVIAVIQIIHLLWLTYAPTGRKTRRQPDVPVMPTMPQHSMMQQQGGAAIQQVVYGTQSPASTPAAHPVAAGVTNGKMVILSGLQTTGEIPLPSNEFGIGRFQNAELNVLIGLDDRSISRRHARFSGNEPLQEYYLTDTDSSYGTSIRVENHFQVLTPGRPERIYNEDVVQVGNSVTIRFVLPGDTRASSTRL
jgi:pSer/pThr/pTyr-binding forkhead associated (FHA) protein